MMDRTTDVIVARAMKKWAAQHGPPANGRARLMWAASRSKRKENRLSALFPNSQLTTHTTFDHEEWSLLLVSWVFEHPFPAGARATIS
jgi:hypothetical protein